MSEGDAEMTKREINRRVFEGRDYPGVFFQPRMEPWFAWHREMGKLPSQFEGMSLRELYDHLGLSMRYMHYYTDVPGPVRREYAGEVEVSREQNEAEATTTIRTPHGDLVERFHKTVDKTWRTVEFPVKSTEDFPALRWVLERTTYRFVAENFERGSEFVGPRGEPQFWLPKSPYQALCQQFMKLQDFIYALTDAPGETDEVMALIDRSYDRLYEELIAFGGVRIVNFGENIHDSLLSPRYFEEYLIPWYERRVGWLREAGIFTHVHIDGYFESLLPYLAELPFDGFEALTPEPQGDVSLEQIAEGIGEKVLLDGVPAIFFLPHYPRERLTECVERVVELFYPRLVLGISDELPEGAGPESIERLRWVSEYCAGASS